MKRIIMLLCAASVIVMSACHCSSHKPNNDSLAGIWVLDSLHVNDSSKNIGWLILLANMNTDSGRVSCQFNKDSSFQSVIGKDSAMGKFATSNDTVSIEVDSSLHSYKYSLAGDSLLQLIDADSTRLLFYRKL